MVNAYEIIMFLVTCVTFGMVIDIQRQIHKLKK